MLLYLNNIYSNVINYVNTCTYMYLIFFDKAGLVSYFGFMSNLPHFLGNNTGPSFEIISCHSYAVIKPLPIIPRSATHI